MSFDFAFYLTLVVIVSGLIVLCDVLFWRKHRGDHKQPVWVEWSRSLFPVLLAVWIIRSFIVQPYRVPTGSLEPTILPGDFIAVSEFSYGLRLPVINSKIVPIGEPKRGDIALFRYPPNPKVVFVKRAIGLPGDHIVYRNKQLFINGKLIKRHYLGKAYDYGNAPGEIQPVDLYEEDLLGTKHKIFLHPHGGETQNTDVRVPAGHYFMMGDNRDDSDDSRFWGAVPEANLIGKAFGIWMSWDPINHRVRWKRIGKSV